jgi:hypothetical protein
MQNVGANSGMNIAGINTAGTTNLVGAAANPISENARTNNNNDGIGGINIVDLQGDFSSGNAVDFAAQLAEQRQIRLRVNNRKKCSLLVTKGQIKRLIKRVLK